MTPSSPFVFTRQRGEVVAINSKNIKIVGFSKKSLEKVKQMRAMMESLEHFDNPEDFLFEEANQDPQTDSYTHYLELESFRRQRLDYRPNPESDDDAAYGRLLAGSVETRLQRPHKTLKELKRLKQKEEPKAVEPRQRRKVILDE